MEKNCIIFDMDGTLIDSRKDITSSVNFVRERKGLPPLKVEDVVEAINGDIKDLAMKFYNTKTYQKEDRKLFEEHYMEECTKNAKVYDGITDILERLKIKNKILAVATNAPTKFAEKMIKAANIYKYFDYIKGCDGDLPPKPHPHILLYLLEKLHYKIKKDCVFVGDNESDFLAASAANINYIVALWGFGINRDLNQCGFKAYCPADIIKYIEAGEF